MKTASPPKRPQTNFPGHRINKPYSHIFSNVAEKSIRTVKQKMLSAENYQKFDDYYNLTFSLQC